MTFIVLQVNTANDQLMAWMHFYQSKSHKSSQIMLIGPLTNQIIRKNWISYSGFSYSSALTTHPIIFFPF